MATSYTSKYANGAAVDAALDLAGTAIQAADLGTAAYEDTGAFATAAQGALAATAVQPGQITQITALLNGAF